MNRIILASLLWLAGTLACAAQQLGPVPPAQYGAGSTSAGQVGPLIQGAVTTAAPAYTSGQTDPLSLTTAGAVRVDNSAVNQPIRPSTGTVTDRSGTIATGGTSQQLAATNGNRQYLLVQNPCSATEDLFVNFTAAATTTGNSVELTPCGTLSMESSFVSTEQVNVIAATTGHVFVSKEK